MRKIIKWKRGTAAQWATVNPVLKDGEPGLERDTGKFKLGDGVSTWSMLPYFIPFEEIVEEPDPPDDIDATLAAWGALNFGPDQIGYSTGPDAFALTALTPQARSFIAALTPAAQRGILSTYSIAEIDSIFAQAIPMSLISHSNLNTNFVTSNGSPSPGPSAIIPISVGVVGENKPVWVEFRGLVSSDLSNSTVRAWLRMNGSYSAPAGAVTAALAYPQYPNEISIKRNLFLGFGINYTFDIGIEHRNGGTATILGDPNMGATLSVYRA